MSDPLIKSVDRREFLQAGVAATAVAASIAPGSATVAMAEDKSNTNKPILPTRVLGKTGVEVTLLNQGTSASLRPSTAFFGLPIARAFATSIRPKDIATPRQSSTSGSTLYPEVRKTSSSRPRATSARR